MIRQFTVVQAFIIIIALVVSNRVTAQNNRNGTLGQATQSTRVNATLKTGDTPYVFCYGTNTKCTGSGCSQVKVITPSNSDVLVTLKQNGKVVAHAYIRASSSYTFEVPNGTYQPFFYYGKNWDSQKVMTQTICGTQKNAAGKYTLFPEETAKLSPPPTEIE